MQRPARSRRGRFRWVVGIYALSLLASGVVRWTNPEPRARPYQRASYLPPVKGDRHTDGEPVRLAYAEAPGPDTPVVLLHGSPVASSSMMQLHDRLAAQGHRVLTPDLPGFEGSTHDIPDYSVQAHGRYLLSWLDSLGVARAHFVAYSMSGGVVLEAYRMDPRPFASVIMLSAIGVQELELTGDYYLNHAIHGLQLGGLWLIREGIPHFGYLDDAILGVPYARNFYDTDQRPLRPILEAFEPPMRIIQAVDDPLVPYAAAEEHARLVPQSEFITMGFGGHGLPFSHADTTAALIQEFVSAVNAGLGVTRAQADPDRLEQAAVPFDPNSVPRPRGFTIVVLMFLVAVATLASEDLASIGSGLMAARGTLTFPEATLAALAGIVFGDVALYLAGRWIGRPLIRRAPFRWFISANKLREGERWFDANGIRSVLVARFVPGTRLPTYVAAGVLKAPFFRFLAYFMAAALLWTPAVVGASMLLGQRVLRYYEAFEQYALWVALALALILFLAVRVVPQMATHLGRRRLRGRWLRLTRWEFWPPWVFYPPVVLYGAWLSIRHRSPLLFTATNPAIPMGGLVGESKFQILRQLPEEWVGAFRLIEAGDDLATRQQAVSTFMTDQGLDYPIVLKPDVGERGRGVAILDTPGEVTRYLEQETGDVIAQRFVTGDEFGVFFYQDPDTEEGKILSITDKRLPHVVGDGVHSLKQLILNDERAVAMHRTYEQVNAARLETVPADGERVQLVQLGTHCRGAVFLDGSDLITDDLTRTITGIANRFKGFHFGRFDVRAPGREALASGGPFTILELNGVTSEATHIYHPGYSLFRAYGTLFRQWSLAYRIGAINRSAGEKPAGPLPVIRALLRHSRRVRSA